MSSNWLTENLDSTPKIKFDSLKELKKELGLTNLDTSKDAELKEKISFEFTRWELDSLKAELSADWVDKLAKLKQIVKEKTIISQDTKREVWILKQEFMKETPTPEWMRKAFEYIEKNQVKWAHKYMMLSVILDKFIYKEKLLIREEWRMITNFEVVDNEWKISKEYTEILDKNLTKEDYKQTNIFNIALKKWDIEKEAIGAAKKYWIALDYKNETEKQQIKSQILINSSIAQEDKTLLMVYLDWWYQKTNKIAQDFAANNKKWLEENAWELSKAWIDISKAWLANYARNPEKLVWDVVGTLAKNPILLFSTIWLILWKIFWFDIKWEKWSIIMKLFAWWMAYGIYKQSWLAKHVWDAIEWKDWARGVYSDAANSAWSMLSWSWNKLKTLPDTITSTSKEMAEKMNLWYFTRNYSYIHSNWEIKDVMDSDYADIKAKMNNGLFAKAIEKKDKTPNDDKDVKQISEKIQHLETEWVKKFGTKEKLNKAVEWKTLTEVVVMVSGDKKTWETKTQERQAPKTANNREQKPEAPTVAPVKAPIAEKV